MPKSADKRIETLRDQLLSAQSQLTRDKSFALAIVVTGEPTAGRSEVVNKLLEWVDPKHVTVHALDKLGDADTTAPAMQRYWLTLPARGDIAIYFLGWYDDLLTRALHTPKKAQRTEERVVARIKQLESMLTLDRIRIVKLDLRLERKIQKERIAALRADKATRWRVTQEDRWLAKHYDRVRAVSDRAIAATDSSRARWHVVNGKDPEGRLLQAGSHVLKELTAGFKSAGAAGSRAPATAWRVETKPDRKAFKTRAATVTDDEYEKELAALQRRLALLSRKKALAKRGVVLAFEGMDAAGKGGAIRRLTAALDARQFTVVPISAPTPEELAHPYLWRFWRRIPKRGDFAIFDRSWYGRVLVERVRDLTPDADWQRAYDEINEFELQLAESKLIVHKFWLAVGKDEQLQRFKDREEDALKRYKVDREDWANRRSYDAYQIAAREMIERTSTEHAPWTVVEADDKKYARLKVLRTVCETLARSLKKSS
jgi:polyphosphate:AMP phosphotransferase